MSLILLCSLPARLCRLEIQFYVVVILKREDALYMMHCSQKRRCSILLDLKLMKKTLLFMMVIERVDQSLTSVIMFVTIVRRCKTLRKIATSCIIWKKKKKLTTNYKGKWLDTLGEAVIVENCSSDENVLVISNGDSKRNEYLILDTACTFFVCFNRDLFSTYEEFSKGVVVTGSNTLFRIASIRRIRLNILDQSQHLVQWDTF